MIPKVIHYCWFGKGEINEMGSKCIESWKNFLPDYEIKEWNESNFDVNCCKLTREAYAMKKYAFVADYVRLYALYNYGGIYLDTDVEVLKSFTPLLSHKSFIGFEFDSHIGTAVIGSKSNQEWIKDLINYYEKRHFISWTGKRIIKANPLIFEDYFVPKGIVLNNEMQYYNNNFQFYPLEYLCGYDYGIKKKFVSKYTYCIHHYEGSWSDTNTNLSAKIITRVRNIFIKIKCYF